MPFSARRPADSPRAWIAWLSVAATSWLTLAAGLSAQTPAAGPVNEPLRQFTASVELLARRVTPSVVQVLSSGYGPVAEGSQVISRQRSVGSGVVIDADGYVLTNAHVVTGAQRVQVVIATGTTIDESPLRWFVNAVGRTVDAHIAGIAPDVDLALLKVDVPGLTALPIGDYDKLRLGEVVFAFGSPAGLRNSMTMGLVSGVARQIDPESPMIYIQTDAPINRGNSGGPLVNVNGELVGINTFILSDSGGNQGLGFAIPSAIVNLVYHKLRIDGHFHRGEIGLAAQSITPDLASGLGLPRSLGVVVSDVLPGGPADRAGVRVRDIIVSVDDVAIGSPADLILSLYGHEPGDRIKIGVVRGTELQTREVLIVERPPDIDQLVALADSDHNLVRRLGILATEIDVTVASLLPSLRLSGGVIVVGRADSWRASGVSLTTGDVIHAVNDHPVLNLTDLRAALDAVGSGGSVVLQIERSGRLMFVAFQLD